MRPLRGIVYKLISVVCFIVMSAMIKYTAPTIPAGEAVFFRSLFAIPVILLWLAMTGHLSDGFKTDHYASHLRRAVTGIISMALGFAALGFLPLPEVTVLSYTGPLLLVVFAAWFLGESVRAFRISMVILGLIGVVIVLFPRLTVLNQGVGQTEAIGVALTLGAAVFMAFAQVFIRKLVEVESTATIVFYFSLNGTLLSLLSLPFGWVWPSALEAALLIGIGLIGGLGQILLTASYREADASLVAPFDYASILFALIIGYFAFDEVPNLSMLIGAAIIICAGVLIILRERYLGIARAKAHKHP